MTGPLTIGTGGYLDCERITDHGIKVGTIRGRAVGSLTGEYIHMYSRVHIGSPSGWGSVDAPNQGLSTYGGAYLAVNNGTVSVGTISPDTSYKFYVNGISYFGGRAVLKGDGSSYNECLRLLPASNGWSNIFFSANDSVSGTHDGGWLIGRRGAVGGVCGAIGDFTIEEQESNGSNLTIHKDGKGATLQGNLSVVGAGSFAGRAAGGGDDEGIVINFAANGYAGLCLGSPSSKRSVFYLRSDTTAPFWRYHDGSTGSYDIIHPGKAGTIALTSDFGAYLPLAGGTMTGKLNLLANQYNYHSDTSSYCL
jgi:hypothetical protein